MRNRITVVRCPGTDRTPMLKLANRQLLACGFSLGTRVSVEYERGRITISLTSQPYEPDNIPGSQVPVSAC